MAANDEFREVIDRQSGTISAHGRLTARGADLIRGAAMVLHRAGHARIHVDLRDVRFADAEGRAALRELTGRLRARSWELTVLCEASLS